MPPTPSTARFATSWHWQPTPAAGYYREMGDAKTAEQDYRLALELLDTLVTDFPTVPRYRESLARACNSLA